MNQGRIWCVVNPTVGLPLFLGSVALMSFTVHFAVLNNSTWVKDFFNGVPLTKASVDDASAPVAQLTTSKTPELAVEVSEPKAAVGETSTSFVVKVTPLAKTAEKALPESG